MNEEIIERKRRLPRIKTRSGMSPLSLVDALKTFGPFFEAAGYVIVPKEPTPEMVVAGIPDLSGYDHRFDSYETGVWNIYVEMIEAAPK